MALAIEAATSQPSESAPVNAAPVDGFPNVPTDLREAEAEFVFQVGKALRRKVLKRFAGGEAYWELPHVKDRSFVVAVEAFHDEGSLFHSVSFLTSYLFGLDSRATRDTDGRLVVTSVPRSVHEWNGKTIPSGFFNQPGAQHIAAVLFSNGGTAAQFTRIGTQRGLGDAQTAVIRFGTCADHDQDADIPAQFGYLVGDLDAPNEDFAQALHLIHNPHAVRPLPRRALPGVTEHWLDPQTGLVTSAAPGFSPFTSLTSIFTGRGAERIAREFLENWFSVGW